MQILYPFVGSVQQYFKEIADPDRYRPDHCPQCEARRPLTAHGFYSRTLVDAGFDGAIRVRRYLCRSCKRTVSLLPEFALPYLRFGITVISLFLVARLLQGATLSAAAMAAAQVAMPYQRGQFWVRRFHRQSVLHSRSGRMVAGTEAGRSLRISTSGVRAGVWKRVRQPADRRARTRLGAAGKTAGVVPRTAGL